MLDITFVNVFFNSILTFLAREQMKSGIEMEDLL